MELLLSDKFGRSLGVRRLRRVREAVATKRNIGDLRIQDNLDSNGDSRNVCHIGNQGNKKSVVTIVTKVVTKYVGFRMKCMLCL